MMETIKLQNKDEINQFYTFLNENPDVVIAHEGRKYILNTDQIIELPENKYENKLVFGKDLTEEIVNISFKNNKIYKYFKDGSLVMEDYFPYFLSHEKGKVSQELKGNQYFKYINHYPIDKFEEIQEANKWSKELWFPRSLEEGYMMLHGSTYFKGLKLNDVSVLSFDIENLDEKRYNHKDLVVIISNTFRNNAGIITKKLFSVKDYKDSVEMVKAWCDWVRQVNPDVITGHNGFAHDFRILNLVTKLKLGRDGSDLVFDKKESKFRKDGQQQYKYFNARIHGRDIIDSFFMSIRFDIGRKFPSYGLKAIEKHLNLQPEDRIEWDFELNPVQKTMNDPELWKQFLKYAEADSDSPLKMIDLMLPTIFYFNQSVPKTLQQMGSEATGSQLDSMMIRSYLQDGYSQPKTSGKVEFEGAISLGIPGIYTNVKKVDVTSLYPSIMLQYNIYDKNKDPNKHILQILDYLRTERIKNKSLAKETKDKYYDDLQNTQKIGINSLYGFLGAGYLLYNYPKGAGDVTRHGRNIIIKTTEWATGHTLKRDIKKIVHEGEDNQEIQYEWILGDKIGEGKGYTLINGDTDSISYCNYSSFTKQEFENEIKEINSLFPELINFESDGVFSKFIVVKAKNYIMLEEGKTKYKLKGSSITDQKKEPALREFLEKMIDCLVYDKQDQLVNVYNTYVKESQNIQDISRWATKKTITKAVFESDRSNETKILEALEGESIQEGDKVYLFSTINGEKQKIEKGMPVFLKDGTPKMIPNKILKLSKNWIPGEEDKEHYLNRVYSTLEIMQNVIDINQFIDYGLKKNKHLLLELLNGKN
jgi:DNA polymerase elongation subunit (family B)